MTEQAFLLGKAKSLVGILTQPSAGNPADDRPAIILLNAGLVHRVGPNRIYVKIARRLAASGFPVLRFDLSGVGDSRARNDDRDFNEGVLSDVKEAMDFLARHKGVERFILMGICSGANNSLRAAHGDPRIIGAVPIESYYFTTLGYYLYIYGKRLLWPKSWWRLITMKSDLWNTLRNKIIGRALEPSDMRRSRQSGGNQDRVSKTQMAAEIQDLLARGIHLYLVYCLDSPSHYNYCRRIRTGLNSLNTSGKLQTKVFRQSDHTFTLLSNQEELVEAIHGWANGIVQSVDPTSSCATKESHA